ncbi:MAG: hypothetical protein A3G87_02395 [Omnitrophica bacterium RIFCSPLOWO2_12_FULL_50_11]|nr:MAG: hypothetical protein A3G87_02395 [Omnitrophica bacterium RIFCSPLOWO2_12_FULL_50_11]
MTTTVPQGNEASFLERSDDTRARNLGKVGHELSSNVPDGNFSFFKGLPIFAKRPKVQADGFSNVGHRFPFGFPLRGASRKFGNVDTKSAGGFFLDDNLILHLTNILSTASPLKAVSDHIIYNTTPPAGQTEQEVWPSDRAKPTGFAHLSRSEARTAEELERRRFEKRTVLDGVQMREKVREILADEETAPDALTLLELVKAGLTKEDIEQVAASIPELASVAKLDMGNIYTELDRLRPYLYEIVDELFRRSGDERLLFMERDARLLYLAAFLRLRLNLGESQANAKILRIPGSQGFYAAIKHFDPSDARRFFEYLGITRDAIEGGRVFHLVDTGFMGNVGQGLRARVAALFYGNDYFKDTEIAAKLATVFPIHLVSLEDTDVAHVSQIKSYAITRPATGWRGEFPGMMRLFAARNWESEKVRLDTVLAGTMQLFPHYHDYFDHLVERDGHLVGAGNLPRLISEDSDRVTGINESVVNPVAALMGEIYFIKQILSDWVKGEPESLKDFSRAEARAEQITFPIHGIKRGNPVENYVADGYEDYLRASNGAFGLVGSLRLNEGELQWLRASIEGVRRVRVVRATRHEFETPRSTDTVVEYPAPDLSPADAEDYVQVPEDQIRVVVRKVLERRRDMIRDFDTQFRNHRWAVNVFQVDSSGRTGKVVWQIGNQSDARKFIAQGILAFIGGRLVLVGETVDEFRSRFPAAVRRTEVRLPAGEARDDAGLCVTGDTLLPIAGKVEGGQSKVDEKAIVDVTAGDYVLSLNEETKQIEPRRINALLDMGIKPVYKLTTASGRSIRTTANHPYLVKVEGGRGKRNGMTEWMKVSELSVGDEIAVPKRIPSRFSIGFVPPFHAFHEDRVAPQVEGNTVVSDTEAVRAGRQVHERLRTNEGIWKKGVISRFVENPLLDFVRERFKISFGPGCQLNRIHTDPYAASSFCRTSSKGIQPFLSASLTAFFRDTTKSGFAGSFASIVSMSHPAGLTDASWYSSVDKRSTSPSSILDKMSNKANVSKINSWGTPSLSITTPALDLRPNLKMAADTMFRKGTNLAVFLFAGMSFIAYKYTTLSTHLSNLFLPKAYAEDVVLEPSSVSNVLWDPVRSIELVGLEHVYDIEVDGTHNFIGNGIFAHNTYTQAARSETRKGPTRWKPRWGLKSMFLALTVAALIWPVAHYGLEFYASKKIQQRARGEASWTATIADLESGLMLTPTQRFISETLSHPEEPAEKQLAALSVLRDLDWEGTGKVSKEWKYAVLLGVIRNSEFDLQVRYAALMDFDLLIPASRIDFSEADLKAIHGLVDVLKNAGEEVGREFLLNHLRLILKDLPGEPLPEVSEALQNPSIRPEVRDKAELLFSALQMREPRLMIAQSHEEAVQGRTNLLDIGIIGFGGKGLVNRVHDRIHVGLIGFSGKNLFEQFKISFIDLRPQNRFDFFTQSVQTLSKGAELASQVFQHYRELALAIILRIVSEFRHGITPSEKEVETVSKSTGLVKKNLYDNFNRILRIIQEESAAHPFSARRSEARAEGERKVSRRKFVFSMTTFLGGVLGAVLGMGAGYQHDYRQYYRFEGLQQRHPEVAVDHVKDYIHSHGNAGDEAVAVRSIESALDTLESLSPYAYRGTTSPGPYLQRITDKARPEDVASGIHIRSLEWYHPRPLKIDLESRPRHKLTGRPLTDAERWQNLYWEILDHADVNVRDLGGEIFGPWITLVEKVSKERFPPSQLTPGEQFVAAHSNDLFKSQNLRNLVPGFQTLRPAHLAGYFFLRGHPDEFPRRDLEVYTTAFRLAQEDFMASQLLTSKTLPISQEPISIIRGHPDIDAFMQNLFTPRESSRITPQSVITGGIIGLIVGALSGAGVQRLRRAAKQRVSKTTQVPRSELRLPDRQEDQRTLSRRTFLWAAPAALAAAAIAGITGDVIFKKPEQPIQKPQKIKQPDAREELIQDVIGIKKELDHFLNQIAEDSVITANPQFLSAVEAFRNEDHRLLAGLTEEQLLEAPLAGFMWKFVGEGENRILDHHILVNAEAFRRLLIAAERNPIYRDVFIAVVLKEGHTVAYYVANQDYLRAYQDLKDRFSSLTAFDVRNAEHVELAERLAVMHLEAETVGIRVALDYLQKKNIGSAGLRKVGEPETDRVLSAALFLLFKLLDVFETKSGEAREIALKVDFFKDEVYFENPKLVEAIFQIAIARGVASYDETTGEVRMSEEAAMEFFKFLQDPKYLPPRPEVRVSRATVPYVFRVIAGMQASQIPRPSLRGPKGRSNLAGSGQAPQSRIREIASAMLGSPPRNDDVVRTLNTYAVSGPLPTFEIISEEEARAIIAKFPPRSPISWSVPDLHAPISISLRSEARGIDLGMIRALASHLNSIESQLKEIEDPVDELLGLS